MSRLTHPRVASVFWCGVSPGQAGGATALVGSINIDEIPVTTLSVSVPITVDGLAPVIPDMPASAKLSKKDKKKSEDEEPSPNDSESKEHHLDAGTTILHAFQKLNPDQVLQMRDDTKELMETQKQLMETLSSLGPQVKQGAELVDSFKSMFSGNLPEVLGQ